MLNHGPEGDLQTVVVFFDKIRLQRFPAIMAYVVGSTFVKWIHCQKNKLVLLWRAVTSIDYDKYEIYQQSWFTFMVWIVNI